MFEIKVLSHFAAAHKLQMVAKKCENLHGHNWKIESCVIGEKLNEAGVLMDFGELKKYIAEIMERLDHKYLNDLNLFQDNIPSSENVARHIAEELQKYLEGTSVKVSRIKVWESENSCATYTL